MSKTKTTQTQQIGIATHNTVTNKEFKKEVSVFICGFHLPVEESFCLLPLIFILLPPPSLTRSLITHCTTLYPTRSPHSVYTTNTPHSFVPHSVPDRSPELCV